MLNVYVETPYYTVWDARDQTEDDLKDRREVRKQSTGDAQYRGHFSGTSFVGVKPVSSARMRQNIDLRAVNAAYYEDAQLNDATHVFARQMRNHKAFLVHHLLYPSVCNGLIAFADGLLESTDTQYAQYDRRSERALFYAPELAATLYHRVVSLMKPEDYSDRVPLCFGHDGTWVPHSINPVLKVVKYTTGGHFAEHRDGPWIPREDQASLFTIVVYLNNDFTEGCTTLFGELANGRAFVDRYVPDAVSVAPQVGMGLVFNHDMSHSASPVRSGVKYILRAELIFERVTTGVGSLLHRYAYLRNEAYKTAARLYRESNEACAAGEKATFVAKYQQVVEEQRKAADASFEDFVGSTVCTSALVPGAHRARALTDAEFAEVLLFLSDADVVGLMATSRKLYAAIALSPMWRQRCVLRFGEALPASLRAAASSSAVAEHLPWITIYQQQRVFARRFAPCVLWPSPCGTLFSSLVNRPLNTRCLSPERRLQGAPLDDACYNREHAGHTWVHCPLPDIYGNLSGITPLHMNFPISERVSSGYGRDPDHVVNDPMPVCRDATKGGVEWSSLVTSIDALIDATWVPVILIDFPTVGAEDRPRWRKAAARDLFEIFRFPAIRSASVREAAAARWAVEHNTPTDAAPSFDLVLRMEGAGVAVFLHQGTSATGDAIYYDAGLRRPVGKSAYVAAPITVYVDLAFYEPGKHINAAASDALLPWMTDWQRDVLERDDPATAAVRSASWIMEGAQCLGMRPEFRFECVFRHGIDPDLLERE